MKEEFELKTVIDGGDEPPDHAGSDWSDWKWQLRNAITSIDKLLGLFPYAKGYEQELKQVIRKYPFSITPYYLSLINKTDPNDPVALQALPHPNELKFYFETMDDPLAEEKDSILEGLVHRYPDRVLITLTDMCPMYCRHCTRKREWCKGRWVRTKKQLNAIYSYIAAHPKIRDVILSGGDPLILSDEKLEDVLKNLRRIEHVEIIRIGTRCPVVLPQRITDKLTRMLRRYRPIWLNTHFNHPNEITPDAAAACDRLVSAGIPVNNQSVLLKGVNDDAAVMTRLCQGLLKIGVRPYYLFECDPVNGTAHFRTSIDKGIDIIRQMRGFTSGLCVPTFVVDGLCGEGKIPIQPNYVLGREEDCFVLQGFRNKPFKYFNPEG